MVHDMFAPMNHREIEYHAKKLSGCVIPDSPIYDKSLLQWLDETGKRVFDEDLVMDYGTDCLRLYLLFENTPRENDAPYYDSWNEGALEGIYKFLGRYRRMILAADEWNRRGGYDEEMLPASCAATLDCALKDAVTRIRKCIDRGNTMPNRHNMVAAMMGLVNTYQKELKTGRIVTSLHDQAIASAAPHGGLTSGSGSHAGGKVRQNPDAARLCRDFIVLMSPYAPDLSRILWMETGGCTA